MSPVLLKKVGIMWGTCGDFVFSKTRSAGKLFHLRTKITALLLRYPLWHSLTLLGGAQLHQEMDAREAHTVTEYDALPRADWVGSESVTGS